MPASGVQQRLVGCPARQQARASPPLALLVTLLRTDGLTHLQRLLALPDTRLKRGVACSRRARRGDVRD